MLLYCVALFYGLFLSLWYQHEIFSKAVLIWFCYHAVMGFCVTSHIKGLLGKYYDDHYSKTTSWFQYPDDSQAKTIWIWIVSLLLWQMQRTWKRMKLSAHNFNTNFFVQQKDVAIHHSDWFDDAAEVLPLMLINRKDFQGQSVICNQSINYHSVRSFMMSLSIVLVLSTTDPILIQW